MNFYVWSKQIFNISEQQYFINFAVCNGVCKKYNAHTFLLQTGDILVKYFLGVFTKLQRAAISFVMSVRVSVHMEHLSSPWTDFHEILYLRIFKKKTVEKIQASLKLDKNKGYFT